MLDLDRVFEGVQRLFDEHIDNEMEVPAHMMARLAPQDPESAAPKHMEVFAPLVVGVADAADPIFEEFRRPEVVGKGFLTPREWLESAQSVISIFFPFSKEVCISNREPGVASPEWQYAKFAGNKIIDRFCALLSEQLRADGWEAVVPAASERFAFSKEPSQSHGEEDFKVSSAWSERHAAWACGLGTFGLSRGIITRRGMAGRFGSVVTSAPIASTPREYTEVYEWCTFCGACVRRCPVNAIDLMNGKSNAQCHEACMAVEDAKVYGDACGKCQVGVPCATRKPLSLKPKPRPRA